MKVAQHWRLNNQRYLMSGAVDNDGNVNFPPRPEVEHRTEIRYDLSSMPEFEHTQPTDVPVRFVSVA